jgi:hypothetical protein
MNLYGCLSDVPTWQLLLPVLALGGAAVPIGRWLARRGRLAHANRDLGFLLAVALGALAVFRILLRCNTWIENNRSEE